MQIKKNAKGAPPSICRVGLVFSGNIHAAAIHRNQFRNPAKPQLLKLLSTFSLALKLPQLRLQTIPAQASSFFARF